MFKDVIGHEEIKQRLITSLQNGRISHAQLFAGNTGYGSMALALAFAQYVFCTGHKKEDACGECPSFCNKFVKRKKREEIFKIPARDNSDTDRFTDSVGCYGILACGTEVCQR